MGVHLNPADQELRLEDLDWARHLIQQVPFGPLMQFPAMFLVQIFFYVANSYFIHFELGLKNVVYRSVRKNFWRLVILEIGDFVQKVYFVYFCH